jgi:glutamyl-Q tRNA(Asp) synthetase
VDTAQPYIGRFAPSPTGPLHFGSLVAALASWLDARATGGRWRVRIEDLDRPRCVPGMGDVILRQLECYGLNWDGDVLYQSARDAAYADALHVLSEASEVYACRCTRSQLAGARRNVDGETIYPGTCRRIPATIDQAHAWRVRVPTQAICFTDRVRGEQCQNLADGIGDFVVKRADGLFAYQLAVVVDDAFQSVTHVVRGADLLGNTPRQIWLQTRLGVPTPHYAHTPLVTTSTGQKLSKQSHATALPEHAPNQILTAALGVLGHAPPAELRDAPTAELLAWAIAHWRVETVPTLPAQYPVNVSDHTPRHQLRISSP